MFKTATRPARQPLPFPSPVTGWKQAEAVGGAIVAQPKAEKLKGGKDEQQHKSRLAQLGCMVCRRLRPLSSPGAVELHHLRTGGWGKGDYRTLMPLCAEHHRGATGVHGLGTKGFAKHYGFDQQDLLNDVNGLLGLTTKQGD